MTTSNFGEFSSDAGTLNVPSYLHLEKTDNLSGICPLVVRSRRRTNLLPFRGRLSVRLSGSCVGNGGI